MWRITVLTLAVALAACSDDKAAGGSADPLVADGRTIAQDQCSQCHAIGASGESANPKAPVFRTILGRYAEGALVDDLSEGIRIGHPDMPSIQLRPEGIDALMAYIRSVQEKPPS